MTNKTADKKTAVPPKTGAPTHEEVHAIYQCHTLAHMVYQHLTSATPWWSQTAMPVNTPRAATPQVGFPKDESAFPPPWPR